MPNRVVIASIYPIKCVVERPLFRPANRWEFEAVPRGGKPSVVVVEDVLQREFQPITNIPTDRTILAQDVAEDIINELVRQGLFCRDGSHPGIWICAGDGPSPEEVQHYLPIQASHLAELVHAADDTYRQNRRPTPLMYAAADWLRVENRPWQEFANPDALIRCPWCTKSIPATAVVCPECQNVVNQEKYVAMKAAQQPPAAEATKVTPPLNPTAPKAQVRA